MNEQVSQESLMGGVKKTLDTVLGGHLKHAREADYIAKQCRSLKDSAMEKTLKDEYVCNVIRPDLDKNKDYMRQAADLLEFLQYFHSENVFRDYILWAKQMRKVMDGLDFSSRERAEAGIAELPKKAPQGYLDKMPQRLRTMVGPGTIKRLYLEKDDTWESEDGVRPLPGFERFYKPGVLLQNQGEDGTKPYRGTGELPVLTVKEIQTIMEHYVAAERAFQIGIKLSRFGWPDSSDGRTEAKYLKMHGVDSSYKLWSKYIDKDDKVLSYFASLWSVGNWLRGNGAFARSATYSTSVIKHYWEAMYKWAKRSYELHSNSASQESLPAAFKW